MSYDPNCGERFIVTQFKCQYYQSRLMLKIDTKLMEIPVSIFSLKIPIVMSLIA